MALIKKPRLIAGTPALRNTGGQSAPLSDNATSSGTTGGTKATSSGSNVFSQYVDMYYDAYKKDPVIYEQQSEETLRGNIAAWLRPTYDAAIETRKRQTDTDRAELDADAIARGMGASTYVTDVKSRQQTQESDDIAGMETEYGAQLAKYLFDAVSEEKQRALETEMFNRKNEQEAYLAAYNSATSLYAAYLKSLKSTGGSGKAKPRLATTPENCEAFLAGLSGDERRAVYSGSEELDKRYREELIASVGETGYLELKRKYPAAPPKGSHYYDGRK